MFWGYFVNNLGLDFKIVEISMVCKGWVGKVLVRMALIIMLILIVAEMLKLQ